MVEMVCVVTWLAVKPGIVPVPEAPMPVAVLLFVHATVPAGLLVVHVIAGTAAPSQNTFEAGVVMVGTGFTTILKLIAGPLQVPKRGTTEIIAVTAVAELLVATNDGNPPVPEAGNPMLGWLFVQVNVVPAAGVPTNVCAGTVAPEHNVIPDIGVAVGDGFTVTSNVCCD
jgi:hypothetical protein